MDWTRAFLTALAHGTYLNSSVAEFRDSERHLPFEQEVAYPCGMSRGDLWSVAVTLIVTGIGYFVGGPKAAYGCLIVGFAIALILHFTRGHEANGPQLSLEYSAQHAQQHMTYTGLFVHDCGDKSAFNVTLTCEPVGRVRLRFDDMPIQKIDPDNPRPVRLSMEQLGANGVWCSQGGTIGMQIEMLFDRMDGEYGPPLRIPVTIKYFAYGKKRERTSHWFILRDNEMFSEKRIWCAMAQAAGSAS